MNFAQKSIKIKMLIESVVRQKYSWFDTAGILITGYV